MKQEKQGPDEKKDDDEIVARIDKLSEYKVLPENYTKKF